MVKEAQTSDSTYLGAAPMRVPWFKAAALSIQASSSLSHRNRPPRQVRARHKNVSFAEGVDNPYKPPWLVQEGGTPPGRCRARHGAGEHGVDAFAAYEFAHTTSKV